MKIYPENVGLPTFTAILYGRSKQGNNDISILKNSSLLTLIFIRAVRFIDILKLSISEISHIFSKTSICFFHLISPDHTDSYSMAYDSEILRFQSTIIIYK